MHSWRVLILPFLERTDIYDRYRFDEPWDGPNNRKLHDLVLSAYRCPSHQGDGHATAYVAVIGRETAWRGSEPVRLEDVADGPDRTIHLVEVTSPSIHWMEPRDLELDRMSPAIHGPDDQTPGPSSAHPGGANVLLVGGAVPFLVARRVVPDRLRAMLTIRGGEPTGDDP
jgi:prepilin-type processing-associated H-X9-DG protein